MGEVLHFGNPLWRGMALYQNARDATLTKLDGKRDSNRPPTHDDYLTMLFHRINDSSNGFR